MSAHQALDWLREMERISALPPEQQQRVRNWITLDITQRVIIADQIHKELRVLARKISTKRREEVLKLAESFDRAFMRDVLEVLNRSNMGEENAPKTHQLEKIIDVAESMPWPPPLSFIRFGYECL